MCTYFLYYELHQLVNIILYMYIIDRYGSVSFYATRIPIDIPYKMVPNSSGEVRTVA